MRIAGIELLLLLLLSAAPALAQTANSGGVGNASRTGAVRTAAVRLTGSIDLDGKLDEPAWAAASAVADFTQSYPNAGAKPTERTEARVLYDDHALYVGVRAYDDHPDSIAAQLARRDATGIYSDWIHVMVDSYHDRRTAFRFSVNPLGVKKDVLHSNDTDEDVNWDAVWEVVTRTDSLGWTAEYRIPFSQLRFSGNEPAGGRVWGLQIQRDIARRQERDSWAPWTRNDAGYVSRFGDLAGLADVRPVRRMELQPYLSSRLTRAPGDGANPFYSANDFGAKVGADFKLGLTSGLTLTGTVNPDFGQVEVDPAVVNLSAFETFFPEKRPFFVEGADIFQFGQVRNFNNAFFQQFFYSRRIGRAPQRALTGGDVRYVDAPEQSTILGAGKVSGKAGPWSLGVMDALTGEESAQLLTDTNQRLSAPVEPRTNYLVGRARREFRGGNTVVGGMLTATNRDMADTVFTPLLRSGAYLGGLDFEHSWATRVWQLSGYLAGSRVTGSEDVITTAQRAPARYYQRPDADYLRLDSTRTALTGHMEELALSHSGKTWDASLDYKAANPGFEINDLGFQGRTDYRSLNALLGHKVNEPGRVFRDRLVYGFATQLWNYGGTGIGEFVGTGAQATFTNLWNVNAQLRVSLPSLDDRLTRGGPLARSPRRLDGSLYVSSDSRKRFSYGFDLGLGADADGGHERSAGVELGWRPSSSVRVSVQPTWSRERSTRQYVGTFDDAFAESTFDRRYVFAELDQNTVSMQTRLDWTFTRNLSLQLFAQPFVAAGEYRGYKEFLTPRQLDFAVYGKDRGTIMQSEGSYTVDPDGTGPAAPFQFGNRDFNVRSLRGNAVLRWEYRPGSALFFVWQQQRQGFDAVGTFDFGRDAGAVFRAPATNVFLVKATYYLGR